MASCVEIEVWNLRLGMSASLLRTDEANANSSEDCIVRGRVEADKSTTLQNRGQPSMYDKTKRLQLTGSGYPLILRDIFKS